MSAKKVLVIGATGAMGQYVVPELASLGYEVDAVALDLGKSDLPNVHYFQGNAWDKDYFKALVEKRYDGIVNFMSYSSPTLDYYLPLALDNCDHYIFLSSYRVFDNKELPIKEDSPRLIDTGDDMILRNAEDYCIYKARGENFLKYLPYNNYTIIRPAVTYGLMRYHLVTLGNDDTVVEFEITNNRPDCYSIIGLARESAAAFGLPMKHHEPVVKGSNAGRSARCPRHDDLGRRRGKNDQQTALQRSGSGRNLQHHHVRTSHLGRNCRLLQRYLQSECGVGQ